MMILSVPGKPLPDTSGSFCNTKNTWIMLCAFPNATLEYTCKLFFLSFSFVEIKFLISRIQQPLQCAQAHERIQKSTIPNDIAYLVSGSQGSLAYWQVL